MSIVVPRTYQERFLALLDQLRDEPSLGPLDLEGIKIRMEIDELTIGDWVALMRRVRALSEPLRSQADLLMHRVKWFVPVESDDGEIIAPDPTPLGNDLKLLRDFFREIVNSGYTSNERIRTILGELETGLEAVRVLLDSDWLARRYNLFKPMVERFFNLVLAEGGFGNEERFAAARRSIGSMYEDKQEEGTSIEDGKVFGTVLPYLHFIIENHPDPFARYYAVELIARGASRRPFSSLSDGFLTDLFGRALHDGEPLIAATAWKSAYMMSSRFAEGLPSRMFSPQPVKGDLSGAVRWKLYYDHWGPLRYRLAEDMLSMRLMDEDRKGVTPSVELTINDFLPHHPLRDFDSSNDIRQPVMAAKLDYLKLLVAEFGLQDRETIMRLFLKEPPAENSSEHFIAEAAWVLELGSGKRILRQGHHRIAALIVAVSEGIVPEDWLSRVPVDMARYHGPVPEALMERVFGRGEWEDIFPPDMRARLPQILRRRTGGSNAQGGLPPGPGGSLAPAGNKGSNTALGTQAQLMGAQTAMQMTSAMTAMQAIQMQAAMAQTAGMNMMAFRVPHM